jgi:hypothetical protein
VLCEALIAWAPAARARRDLDEQLVAVGMRAGVAGAAFFVLFLSRVVLARPAVRLEVGAALALALGKLRALVLGRDAARGGARDAAALPRKGHAKMAQAWRKRWPELASTWRLLSVCARSRTGSWPRARRVHERERARSRPRSRAHERTSKRCTARMREQEPLQVDETSLRRYGKGVALLLSHSVLLEVGAHFGQRRRLQAGQRVLVNIELLPVEEVVEVASEEERNGARNGGLRLAKRRGLAAHLERHAGGVPQEQQAVGVAAVAHSKDATKARVQPLPSGLAVSASGKRASVCGLESAGARNHSRSCSCGRSS